MENPLDKYNLQKYGVSGSGRTRSQQGTFQNGNAARDARRAARRAQMPATFAQMQEEGLARPAPMAQPYGGNQASSMTYEPDAPSYNPEDRLAPDAPRTTTYDPYTSPPPTGVLRPRMVTDRAAPDTGGTDMIRKTALEELEAAFTGRKAALNEDLARRGIYASSGELGAGARLGDLEGQYARARAALESDLIQGERGNETQLISLLMQLLPLFQTGSRR